MDRTDTRENIQTLQALLGLTHPPPSDPDAQDAVLVAVDFENAPQIIQDVSLKNVNSQIGFAILDTKDLSTSSIADISTYSFATGTSNYCQKVSRRFIFGESINEEKKYILEKIQAIIPDSRSVILIGHDIIWDLRALSHLNPRFQKYRYLDTQHIASQVLPLKDQNKNYALHRLLTYFNCPFYKLHCAGNDANFTLRLLLLLATFSVQNETLSTYQKEIVAKLHNISYALLPPPKLCPHDIALARKQRRVERKRQARFQDPDTIERVRAERARKKEEATRKLVLKPDAVPPRS
ncbi:hypothetical protein TWF281_006309 [Arthrobotrys megalospora]